MLSIVYLSNSCEQRLFCTFYIFVNKYTAIQKTDSAGFFQVGGHHLNEDFSERGKEPKDEVQIYTWKDATLRELTDLVILHALLLKFGGK